MEVAVNKYILHYFNGEYTMTYHDESHLDLESYTELLLKGLYKKTLSDNTVLNLKPPFGVSKIIKIN